MPEWEHPSFRWTKQTVPGYAWSAPNNTPRLVFICISAMLPACVRLLPEPPEPGQPPQGKGRLLENQWRER